MAQVVYSYLEKYKTKNKLTEKEIDSAIRSIHKINSLVSDVIQENFENHLSDINISNLLNDIIAHNKSVFDSKSIEIIKDIDEEIIYKWNKRDFERVINNILANAYYYSNSSSSIEVTLRNTNNVEIIIKDNGIGIKESDLTKIFDKNFRVTTAKESNKRGQGLGLYIVKLLLENIKGSISVESIFNEGSTFKIELK